MTLASTAYCFAGNGLGPSPPVLDSIALKVNTCKSKDTDIRILALSVMTWLAVVFSQQLNKRHLRRSRSLVSLLLWGNGLDDEDGKAKNIKQTELLVDLREAILQIARHFQSLDPKNCKVVRQPVFVCFCLNTSFISCDKFWVTLAGYGCSSCWNISTSVSVFMCLNNGRA